MRFAGSFIGAALGMRTSQMIYVIPFISGF
jgi:hypothetical protein